MTQLPVVMQTLGYPRAVLRAADDAVVQLLDWHPFFPNVLAFAGGGGTVGGGIVGLWDVAGGGPEIVLRPSAAFAGGAGAQTRNGTAQAGTLY